MEYQGSRSKSLNVTVNYKVTFILYNFKRTSKVKAIYMVCLKRSPHKVCEISSLQVQ